ncbi:MAG: hypothetical protein HYZ45_07025 [Burkholderiales bacterium]|nr:hypothetical protein [Burkholderiales bacterium]
MFCPVCNTQNSAMAVRCIQCNSTLIHEATEDSAKSYQLKRQLDIKMYGGYGCIIGAGLAYLFSIFGGEGLNVGLLTVLVLVGGIVGRIVAKKMHDDLD